MTKNSTTTSNYSRRQALRLMAIGGAAGFIAPNLLGKPAFAKTPAARSGRSRRRRSFTRADRVQSVDGAYRSR